MKFSALFRLTGLLIAATMAVSVSPGFAPAAKAASEIKIVVNRQAITSVDIARRVAFLRLQRSGGNLQEKAREQLIEESLKYQEALRVRAVVSQGPNRCLLRALWPIQQSFGQAAQPGS
jgi:peptidyl-prolyl cis-trans isomerase SurA